MHTKLDKMIDWYYKVLNKQKAAFNAEDRSFLDQDNDSLKQFQSSLPMERRSLLKPRPFQNASAPVRLNNDELFLES